uniref:Uncharacterized protein n=1 Tax=Setaria viridis TaxID=4556 RepID=A0A4U6W005_SETVI|nr:hypothetical protein SEVIR_2G257001v2 [Setaria viridis]
MEVGKRDSDAEMAGWQKTMGEIVYHPDGRLKLELESDSVEPQMFDLIHDMNLLLISFGKVEEAASVEIRQELLSKAKRWLVEFEKLKWRVDRRKKMKEKNKEKRSARNSGGEDEGRVVQELLNCLNKISVMINQQLVDFTTKVDLAMGNNLKEGHAMEVDLAMRNSKEGHAMEVDLVLQNSKEGLKGDRSRKGKEARKARKIQKGLAKYEEWRRKKDDEKRHRDPEELTDHYAYEARLFEKSWNISIRPAMVASRTTHLSLANDILYI